MSDILHEINDEMRQKQLRDFWAENGRWVIGSVVLAIVMAAVMTGWRGYQASRFEKDTAAIVSAIKTDAAEKMLEQAKDTGKLHATVARLSAAAQLLAKGEKDKAIAIYSEIRQTPRLDRNWRDLAAVLEATQTLEAAKPEDLHALLESAADKKSVWRSTARELQALVYIREGKTAEAVETLQLITTDAAAPADIKSRAASLADIFSAESKSAE